MLVVASQFERIDRRLAEHCASLNLTGEIKWSKIPVPYAPKHGGLPDAFFEEMMAGHLKVPYHGKLYKRLLDAFVPGWESLDANISRNIHT